MMEKLRDAVNHRLFPVDNAKDLQALMVFATSHTSTHSRRPRSSLQSTNSQWNNIQYLNTSCRCSGYRGIPVHLLLGPVIGPSSSQEGINDPSYGEDPHEEAPREENDDGNC
jgi:hypothetical protein